MFSDEFKFGLTVFGLKKVYDYIVQGQLKTLSAYLINVCPFYRTFYPFPIETPSNKGLWYSPSKCLIIYLPLNLGLGRLHKKINLRNNKLMNAH